MECPVCYEEATEDTYQVLECAHYLCKKCLSNLCQSICPLCRTPINTVSFDTGCEENEIYNYYDDYEYSDTYIRQRHRRRRSRRGRGRNPEIQDVSIPDVLMIDQVDDTYESYEYIPQRHRRRSRRNPEIQTVSIPDIVIEQVCKVENIVNNINKLSIDTTQNDKKRQKCRHNRSVWRQTCSHRISRYGC